MKSRNGSGTVAAIGAIVGLAALGAAGYHFVGGGCLLGGCDWAAKSATVTTVSDGVVAGDRGSCSLGGGECATGSAIATTEAAYFEAGAEEVLVSTCEETQKKSCCPLGETEETKVEEQTASSAK